MLRGGKDLAPFLSPGGGAVLTNLSIQAALGRRALKLTGLSWRGGGHRMRLPWSYSTSCLFRILPHQRLQTSNEAL